MFASDFPRQQWSPNDSLGVPLAPGLFTLRPEPLNKRRHSMRNYRIDFTDGTTSRSAVVEAQDLGHAHMKARELARAIIEQEPLGEHDWIKWHWTIETSDEGVCEEPVLLSLTMHAPETKTRRSEMRSAGHYRGSKAADAVIGEGVPLSADAIEQRLKREIATREAALRELGADDADIEAWVGAFRKQFVARIVNHIDRAGGG